MARTCPNCHTRLTLADYACPRCGQVAEVPQGAPIKAPPAMPAPLPDIRSQVNLDAVRATIKERKADKGVFVVFVMALFSVAIFVAGGIGNYAWGKYQQRVEKEQQASIEAQARTMEAAQQPVSIPQQKPQPVLIAAQPAPRHIRCNLCGTSGYTICWQCTGRGRCLWCGGTGRDSVRNALNLYGDCTMCKGTGICSVCEGRGREVCSACYGAGYLTPERVAELERLRIQQAQYEKTLPPNDPNGALPSNVHDYVHQNNTPEPDYTGLPGMGN